jgi:ABC-2 type transport system permease protein
MKAMSVMVKSLKEQVRDLRGLGLTAALPAAFMVIFGLAFGGGLPTIKLLFEDKDGGVGGQTIKTVLEAYKYADGRPMVELVPAGIAVDASTATLDEVAKAKKQCAELAVNCTVLGNRVKAGDAAAYILVPPGFTNRVLGGTVTDSTSLILGGDPADSNMRSAVMYANDAVNDTIKTLINRDTPSRVKIFWLGEAGTKTEFDWAAPGLMVFAIMLLVAQTAMIVVAEVQRGTLHRLRLTAMSAKDLFLGITGSQMLLAAGQIVFMFIVAVLLGYNYEGSLLFGVVLCIALSLCAVGCGLVTSCIAKTPMEAANFGAGVLMPMVFLSGSMFPIPPIHLFEISGRSISLWHLLPPTHVVEAMRMTLTHGQPWTDCIFQLGATIVLSLGYLVIGIMMFQKIRMKTEY